MSRLKVVFMGTPQFSVPTLEKLVSTYNVVAVYCQPPRPSGRGHNFVASPVHKKAEELGISIYTPQSLRSQETQQEFRNLAPDIAVIVAYGLILPSSILEIPRWGCLNVHASLLPRWRGAAPLQRAIMAGDKETGITIMQMDKGLDTGPVLSYVKVPIAQNTTTSSLHDTMSVIGANLLLQTIDPYVQGILTPVPQPSEGVTYADKVSKGESCVNWNEKGEEINRRILALTPWPGVYFRHQATPIKIASALFLPEVLGTPGEVLDNQLTIACGKGGLRPLIVQRPSGKWLRALEF